MSQRIWLTRLFSGRWSSTDAKAELKPVPVHTVSLPMGCSSSVVLTARTVAASINPYRDIVSGDAIRQKPAPSPGINPNRLFDVFSRLQELSQLRVAAESNESIPPNTANSDFPSRMETAASSNAINPAAWPSGTIVMDVSSFALCVIAFVMPY